MRLGNLIINLSPLTLTVEKATPLQQSEMLRGDVVRDLAILGQLPDRITAMQQQLHDSEANRVSQRLQTLRRVGERIDAAAGFSD
jgi:hypothetical protein